MVLIPLTLFIGIAIWLVWYLVMHDRGEREPRHALWAVFGFGFLSAVAAVMLEGLIPDRYLPTDGPAPFGMGLLLACMAIGVIEESCKFIPAALYIYRKRYFNEHTDGVIYFAIAGLGFGLPENLLYSLQYGTETGLMRLVLTPFFHAAMTGLVGYFLVRVKVDRKPKIQIPLALLGAALVHGLYDFGLFSGKPVLIVLALMITFGISASLFLLYSRSNREDQMVGLSAVGNNRFCRTCGLPNPKRHLYCQRCGKHA